MNRGKNLQQKIKIAQYLIHKKQFVYYRTRAIISRGLYFYYPIFKDQFFVFKEVFSENSVLMYGLYSRAAYDGTHTVFGIGCWIP